MDDNEFDASDLFADLAVSCNFPKSFEKSLIAPKIIPMRSRLHRRHHCNFKICCSQIDDEKVFLIHDVVLLFILLFVVVVLYCLYRVPVPPGTGTKIMRGD